MRHLAILLAALTFSCGAKTGLDAASGHGSGGDVGSPEVLEWTLGPYDADTGGDQCLYFRIPRDFDVGAIEVASIRDPVGIGAYLYRVDEPSEFDEGDIVQGTRGCSEIPNPIRNHRLFTFGSYPDEASPGHRWDVPEGLALALPAGALLTYRLYTRGRHDGDPTLVGAYALRLHERPAPVSGWLGFLFGSNRAEYERQRADCDVCLLDLFARCDPPGNVSIVAAAAAVNEGETRVALIDGEGRRTTPFYNNAGYIAWVETYEPGEVMVPGGGGIEYRCITGGDAGAFPLECAMELLYAPAPGRFTPDISCVLP